MAFRLEEIRDEANRRVRVEHRKLGKRQPAAGPTPRLAIEIRDKLDQLSSRVRRLMPSARDPEAFHVERSEIARELQRLAEKFRD